MLLNVCLAGLLGLASSPLQSLATARAVGDWNPAAPETRDVRITTRGFDWPTIKMKDMKEMTGRDIRDTAGVVSLNDKGKDKFDADSVFVKTKGKPQHELEVYKDIKGKDIVPDVLAVIVDNNDDDKAIGFVQEEVEVEDVKKVNLEDCKKQLEKLHDAGWLHMDAKMRNFKKVRGKGDFIMYDFEDAKKVDDKDAYKWSKDPDDELDDDEREEADLNAMENAFKNNVKK